MLWNYWAEEWLLQEPVSFDGRNSAIVVKEGVTSFDLKTLYSAWKRWVQREQNAMYLPAIRASGGDPIPGGSTGVTYLLMNGWRLFYDPTKTTVTGVLYSEDFDTAYYTYTGSPVYPVSVSAVVNQVTTTQNIITGDLSSLPNLNQIIAGVVNQLYSEIIPVNVKEINDITVVGTGVEGNTWGPA
jgi:hypothetical protein